MKAFFNLRHGIVSLLVLASTHLPARGADEMETQFHAQAPEIAKLLRGKGYKNVGILKFRVKKGDEPATDRAGTLNRRLAEKLELALIITSKLKDPLGIIRDASKTAATIPAANHLSEEGRAKLFTKEYPLAWGGTSVVPDVFLTGTAVISADLQAMEVALVAFDRTDTKLTRIHQFKMKPDLEDLLDSGESFSVRGVFDKASLQLTEEARKEKATTEAVFVSTQVKTETETQPKPVKAKLHPLSPENADCPIKLEILYDNQPQPIEFRSGAAFVAEPKEHQNVVFVVRRKGPNRSRLGVVLKVNGENTLYREKQDDSRCTPWVFEPRLNEFGVYGFQLNTGTSQKFKVLSQAASKAKEMDYGEFVGTISVTVFPEQKQTPKLSPKSLTDEGEDFAVMTRSVFPPETPKNLDALQTQLKSSVDVTRGFIVEGEKVDLGIETVPFTADSVPVMTATIRYYNQQDLPPM